MSRKGAVHDIPRRPPRSCACRAAARLPRPGRGYRHTARQRGAGVVRIRVTRETWNPLVGAALATFGVTHKPPASNHAEICGYAVYYGADLRRNSSLTYRSAQPCAGPCNNALTMQRSIDGTPSCHPGYRARDIAGRFLRTLIDTRLQELTEIALRSRLVPVSRSAAHRSSR